MSTRRPLATSSLAVEGVAADQVLAAIRAYAPKVVLLARFELPQVRAHLEQGYELVYAYYPFRLYVRP